MTIKELVGKGPDELERMTDDQIREYFRPYMLVQTGTIIEDDDSKDDEPVNLEEKGAVKRDRVAEKKRSKEEWMKEMARLGQQQGLDMSKILPKDLK